MNRAAGAGKGACKYESRTERSARRFAGKRVGPPGGALAGGGYWYILVQLKNSLPRLSGTFQTQGLRAPLRIERDDHGVLQCITGVTSGPVP